MRVYLPPDANCLLSVWDHCLRSRHYVNVVIAGKYLAPQWLDMDDAVEHCARGIGVCQWASSDQGADPDVVMACCGDVPTLETLAAVSILREHLPDLKIRVVNVVDLMRLQLSTEHPNGLSDQAFDELFTQDRPIVFAFHGYPWLVHRLTYRRTNHDNLHVRGYIEALDRAIRNESSLNRKYRQVCRMLKDYSAAGAKEKAVELSTAWLRSIHAVRRCWKSWRR